ncbi:hypothetical protein DIPPA_25734 [Diplonema papillatum]|nr:hypothetical protein DIPPA_25734 [Diplonema papillatum]
MTRESPTNQRITFDLDRSGRYLFTGCHSGYVKVYSTRDFSLQSKIPIAPGFGPVNSVSVNPALPVFSVTTGSRVFRVSPLCDAPYTRVTPFLRPFFAKRHKQLRPAPEKEEKPVDLQEDPTVVNPALRENENTTDTSNAMEVDEAPPEEEGVRRIPPDSSSSSASSSSSLSSGSDTESDDAPEVRAFAPLLGAEDQLSNADRSLVGQAAPCMRSTLELWSGKVLYFPLPATKQPAGAAEAAADQQQPAEETCPETTAGEAAPMAG